MALFLFVTVIKMVIMEVFLCVIIYSIGGYFKAARWDDKDKYHETRRKRCRNKRMEREKES